MSDDSRDPERLSDSQDESELARLLRAGQSELPNEAQLRALETALAPQFEMQPAPAHVGFGAARRGITLGALALAIGAVWFAATRHAAPSAGDTMPAHHDADAPPLDANASADPVVASPSRSHSDAATNSSPPSPPPHRAVPDNADTLALEVALLQKAHEALASSPMQTLAKCTEHASRYPHGTLAEERDVLRVRALVALRREAEARAAVRVFSKAYPSSTHRRSLQPLIGDEP